MNTSGPRDLVYEIFFLLQRVPLSTTEIMGKTDKTRAAVLRTLAKMKEYELIEFHQDPFDTRPGFGQWHWIFHKEYET